MSSGMTVSEWCRTNNIAPKNYYYHLRRVREFFLEFNEQQAEKQEIVSVTEISKPIPKFEPESAAKVVIRKDGMEIEVPEIWVRSKRKMKRKVRYFNRAYKIDDIELEAIKNSLFS